MTTSWDWKGRWAFVLAVAAATVLLIAGGKGSAAGAGATASAATSVDINHFAFHPPTLRVRQGARVAFVNSSNVTHTATRAGSFNTGHIKPGKSVTVRFNQKGTFAYHCNIHPFMHGKIVVE